MRPDDEAEPGRYFGEADRSRRSDRKLRQLCRQVERSAALTLAGIGDGALLGATVAAVEPAPDGGRLKVTVLLEPGRGVREAVAALEALQRANAAFRAEAGRSVHRKRVPELVFDVQPGNAGE